MKKVLVKIIGTIIILAIICVTCLVVFNVVNNYSKDKDQEDLKIKKIEKKHPEVDDSVFSSYYDDAKKTVAKMTLEEKVGQLFLVRYNAKDVEYLSNFYPGGYILFAKDFQNHTKESLKQEIDNDQKMNKYKLIMGVDEEGGFVTRVSRYPNFRSERFQSPKSYYEQGGYQLLETVETEKATLLKSIGINLNLAPVADISTNPNDFIYNRSFGHSTEETQEFIKNMVTYSNNNHIASCLKHFPGYGNNLDTHTGIAIDERPYENFKTTDFLPFKAGIDAKVPSILVSHNIVKSMDPDYPASLSSKVINELRNNLGFTGVIMTDDLAMDAVSSYVNDGKAATLAVNAGNDMIITSDFVNMYKEVLESVKNGIIKEEQIDKAVIRVIAWKYNMQLL